jgi:hypothetical protein
MKIQRLPPRVEVGLIHRPECTNNPCTCLDGRDVLIRMLPMMFADIAKMLNDHELIARVDKMYYDGALMRDQPGFDWYYDPKK